MAFNRKAYHRLHHILGQWQLFTRVWVRFGGPFCMIFVSLYSCLALADSPSSTLSLLISIEDLESHSTISSDATMTIRVANKLDPRAPQTIFTFRYHRDMDYSPPSNARFLSRGGRHPLTQPSALLEVSGSRRGLRYLSIEVQGESPEAVSNLDAKLLKLESIKLPYGQYTIFVEGGREQSRGKVTDPWSNKVDVTLAANEAKTISAKSPGMLQTITDATFSREGGYVALVVALLAALGAAVKKEIERTVSRAVDALGAYGLRAAANRKFRRLYLEHLVSTHRFLRLVGFNVAGLPRPLLEEVYISLRVNSYGTKLERDFAKGGTISFVDAVKRFDRLVILGAPGARKTTTLSYILLRLAQHNGSPFFGQTRLPIYIPLRRLSVGARTIVADLTDPKAQVLPDEILSSYPANFFEQRLEKGDCVVLLDGLDEVTDESAHMQVAERINAFVDRYPRNRYIVTCRIAGWRNLLPAFSVLEADELSYDEINRFVRGWHTAIINLQERNRIQQEYTDRDTQAQRWAEAVPRIRIAIDDYSRRLLNAVESNTRIMAVATNPMLLSLICLVHLNRSILPRGRALLYSQCVEFLIDAWERSKGFLVSPFTNHVCPEGNSP